MYIYVHTCTCTYIMYIHVIFTFSLDWVLNYKFYSYNLIYKIEYLFVLVGFFCSLSDMYKRQIIFENLELFIIVYINYFI